MANNIEEFYSSENEAFWSLSHEGTDVEFLLNNEGMVYVRVESGSSYMAQANSFYMNESHLVELLRSRGWTCEKKG